MKVEEKLIGPSEAREMLSANTHNRPLNKRSVMQLANAIKRGEWEENGDAIRFSETGVLLDGQHRLAAIAESGESVKTLVVSGLKDSAFDVIDRGKSRTVGHVLAIRGEKNYNALASVARLLFLYKETGNPFHGNPDLVPTARQIEQLIDDNPGARDAVADVMNQQFVRRYMTPRIGGFCLYAFRNSRLSNFADDFFYRIETGMARFEGDPVILLRDRLMEDRASKEKMSDRYKTALIFKAFKKFSSGDKVKFLRVRTGGENAEKDLYKI